MLRGCLCGAAGAGAAAASACAVGEGKCFVQIVIAGAGEFGFNVAERLSREGHDIVVVDRDEEALDALRDTLDVAVVHGDAARAGVLKRAGVEGADMFLALTNMDETNLVASLIAQRMGASTRIARISNPEFSRSDHLLSRRDFGVDMVISPTKVAVDEIIRLLEYPLAREVADFFYRRVMMIGLEVEKEHEWLEVPLRDLDLFSSARGVLLAAIKRGDETIIPGGDDVVRLGDEIYLLGLRKNLLPFLEEAGFSFSRPERVMIAGGNEIGLELAQALEHVLSSVKLIEPDLERCNVLSGVLREALVLHGTLTDMDLMKDEGLSEMDAFVAVSDDEEQNLLSALLARRHGCGKTFVVVKKPEYVGLVPHVGIDAAVSVRISTVDIVLRYIRRGDVRTVATFKNIDAEAVELIVSPSSPAVGRRIMELGIPNGAILGAVIRRGQYIVPRGGDVVEADDRIIVISVPEVKEEVQELFGPASSD